MPIYPVSIKYTLKISAPPTPPLFLPLCVYDMNTHKLCTIIHCDNAKRYKSVNGYMYREMQLKCKRNKLVNDQAYG